jgi:hypothetical protein
MTSADTKMTVGRVTVNVSHSATVAATTATAIEAMTRPGPYVISPWRRIAAMPV